jgi:hypothetical protein
MTDSEVVMADVWTEAERAPHNRIKRAEARLLLRKRGLLRDPPSQEEIEDARFARAHRGGGPQ